MRAGHGGQEARDDEQVPGGDEQVFGDDGQVLEEFGTWLDLEELNLEFGRTSVPFPRRGSLCSLLSPAPHRFSYGSVFSSC